MNVNVNTNTKNITPPPQQVYVNKQHVDKQRINNQHGFTIIEVALVLAIAGLIFLVVFLALPALQNSQKDTARKQDVGRVVSALQQYEADNGGDLSSLMTGTGYGITGTDASGLGPYVGKLGSEVAYVWVHGEGEGVTPKNGDTTTGALGIYPGSFCLNTTRTTTATSSDAAVVVNLSNGTQYCADM